MARQGYQGIPVFDSHVAARITGSMPLSCLKSSVIGVDALYYLENLLAAHKEPLLSALGGFPLALETRIVKELREIQSCGAKLYFVFNGLDWGIKDDQFAISIASARQNATAFDIYENDRAKEAIGVFRESGLIPSGPFGAPTPAALVPFLKKILHENDIPFIVAPYSALAQLAYFEKHPSQFIDAVYGPSELFVFGLDKIITNFDLAYIPNDIPERGSSANALHFDLDTSSFRWIDRRKCLDELGHIPVDVFQNALLLAGSSLLKQFPPLCNSANYPKGYTLRDVVTLIMSNGRSVVRLCSQYSSDPLVQGLKYPDRYKRTMTGIRHHPIITSEGDVEVLDKDFAPDDMHACVGYRLPEELNMYLSRGMLRPGLLGALNSGIVHITAPLDGGDSPVYQNLVKTQLQPIRDQTLALLAGSLNFYYKNAQTIRTKFWFEPENGQARSIKSITPFNEELLAQWNVRGDAIVEQRRKLEATSETLVPGSLSFAICSLADTSFAERTLLKTRHEITANTIWRFLQVRGYINEKHHLTAWGKVLQAAILKVGPSKDQEEAAFLAVELLRLELLNADTMFAGYSGAPVRGSAVDKRNCMLVSRIATLGKLQHYDKGYRGPLSRHLLAYRSIVSVLHFALRDLLEISLATLFLKGHVDRDRDDWMDLALGLPLYEDHSCALGVVVMSYLDELNWKEDPTDAHTREKQQTTAQGWVPNCDFNGSLADGLQLWDGVYSAVCVAGESVKDKNMWDEVNEWLSQRR
ncbi:MAG: hypothetical protein Q9195_003454 [Heterodermia aff. obscurata]